MNMTDPVDDRIARFLNVVGSKLPKVDVHSSKV